MGREMEEQRQHALRMEKVEAWEVIKALLGYKRTTDGRLRYWEWRTLQRFGLEDQDYLTTIPRTYQIWWEEIEERYGDEDD
jgi:hypothetical protein